MKNKKFLFISLLILAIGFAAVSTTLYISGNLVFGTNKNDFEVYFSGAIIDDEDKSNEVILSDKKHIEYETKELKKLGDTSILEFEVTNNRTQYDAKVSISCTLTDNTYVSYTTDKNEYNIPAQTRESGKVTIELIKASTSILNPTISCELVSTAEERSATAETVITDSSYEITGTLTDEEGNILANKNLVVYSETPHYVTTDDYGFFYVNGLEKGSHEIYYVNEKTVEGKTKEEVKELAEAEARITTSSTKINFENIKLNDFKINVEKEEEINITLDADTGSIDSNTLKINKYQKGSELPTPTPKSSNYEFLGWFVGDKKITNNTIITSEMNLVAKWNYNCPYEVGKVWNYDYNGTDGSDGSSQKFEISCTGTYKLEIWGASGGSCSYKNTFTQGGYGAYAIGYINLEYNKEIYVTVGGKGVDSSKDNSKKGGYNGGGNAGASYPGSSYINGSGGGGATHIAISSGLLSSFNQNKNYVIMVAGGGGGSYAWSADTPSAGGIQGTNGKSASGKISVGATQTSGYAFGQGQNGRDSAQAQNADGEGGCGGGAGWFGGFSYQGTEQLSNSSGSGGSSYIGNTNLTNKAMYCYNCETSDEESTKTISTKCTSATPTENCAKQGNGYARITLVSID